MAVVIGVDPHKGSHTAVAVDQAESSRPKTLRKKVISTSP
jgi:hypothetical protein